MTDNRCPRCGHEDIKCFERTKGQIKYIVYVCKKCKSVTRRKIIG